MSVHTARDDRYHASKPTPLPVRGEITLKKLLFQLDTDTIPSIFDTVVAYDGGADHVHPLSGMSPETCQSVAEGAIYTRPPAAKKNTAIFIGGSDIISQMHEAGEIQELIDEALAATPERRGHRESIMSAMATVTCFI